MPARRKAPHVEPVVAPIKAAARMRGISYRLLYAWRDEGILPGWESGHQFLVHMASFDAFLAERARVGTKKGGR